MGIFRYSSLCLLLLVFIIPNVFADGFIYDGLGVKARGMGGAFRAVADDWSAAYYNPAGYYQIKDNWLAGNLDMVHNRYTAVPNVTWENYPTGYYNGQEIYNDHAVLNIPQGGIVTKLPIAGETVFGFGIMQTFDQNQSWELYANLPGYNDEDYPNKQLYNNLDVVNFQLTAAKGFMEDDLMIGVGLSLVRGDLIFNDVVLPNNPMLDDTLYSFVADRPGDKIPEWYHTDGSGWGFGYKAGLLYNLNEKLRLGLVYNGKTSLDLEGDADFRFYMPDNPGAGQTLISLGVQQTSEEYAYTSGKVYEVSSRFETNFDVPASIGGGLAFQVNEKFLVALDAEMVFWSQFEGFNFDFSDHVGLPEDPDFDRLVDLMTTDISVPIQWDDAGRVMLGSSYQLRDFVQLRGGFGISQTVVTDETFIPQFIDLATKYWYSLGAGFDIDYWRLELAGVYTHHGDVSISTSADVDEDGLMDNIAGDYQADNFRTILGVSYRF